MSATPPTLISALNAAFGKALGDPTLLENFIKGSMQAVWGSPEQLGKLAHSDSEKYARLVKELNISAS